MSSKEKRGPPGPARGSGPPPSPPEAGAPAPAPAAVGSESSAPPAQPPLTLAQPMSPGDPGFRLLLEENAFQALTQEPLLKRPRTSRDALSVGEGSLLCLPFPKKLWAVVNSAQFASIWWAKDGTCIGINEKLFQKEVLEREGPDKVFETDCMKSFVRQLNLYGFSKLRRDVHTSICLTSFLTGGAPVHVLSKLQFYRSPFFQRDCPHLLLRMKRRVAVKSTLRQMESEPEPDALGVPPAAPTPGLRHEGVLSSAGDPPQPESSPQGDGPTIRVRSDSAPPAMLGAAARTTVPDTHAAAGRAVDGQLQGAQAPIPLMTYVAQPATSPWVCVTLPPAQIHPYASVLGLAPGLPVLLPVPTVQLPMAGLLPLYQPWVHGVAAVPGVAAGPVAPVTVLIHPPSPFHCCPDSRCIPEYLPPTAGPPDYPRCAHHRS
ncbi:heat shock transcription factor, X-linked-like [Meles meles]|uniref:heat shock transcription factor, X-linked-like n=1 Tax=Meles meles TaxID=9662 RepID=UPI001E69F517|nr:heat shock transcription factor, X-linked-like [Meles meles]XP_045851907.1 heat shock transcription factor, X-linked-like [Meles meles]